MLAVLVAVCGGVGAACRFVADGWIRSRWTMAFPVATFLVNVTGSLAIGLATGAHAYLGLGAFAFTASTTGFCGGFTTFSTSSVETVHLFRSGEVLRAVANALGTLVACVAAAAGGMALTRALGG